VSPAKKKGGGKGRPSAKARRGGAKRARTSAKKASRARAKRASSPQIPARTLRRTPETLRVRRVSPGLTVNDIHASVRWYRDVLGFVVEEEWHQDGRLAAASLLAGSARFVLGQDDWAKGRDRRKGEGFRLHLATAQDVDQIAARVKANGGRLESEPADTSWGVRAFSIVDPDGFKLTIASEA
jgi:uncharacterized glyoxalase superfamily protein PhnB